MKKFFNITILYFSLDNFIRKEHIEIDYLNLYGNFEQLSVAILSCQNDTECIGVFEEGCHQEGPFSLLKTGYLTTHDGWNCIYSKKDSQGRYEGNANLVAVITNRHIII